MRKRKNYLLLVLSVGFMTIFYLGTSKSKIECITQFGSCEEELAKVVNEFSHKFTLVGFPKKEVTEALMKSEKKIKDIEFHRKFPNTWRVSVALRQAVGAISDKKNPSKFYLVDKEGVVLDSKEQTLLPILVVDDFNLAEVQESRVISALRAVELLAATSSEQVMAELSGLTLRSVISPGIELIIDVEKPSDSWYPPLQTILDRTKIQSKIPRKLDLRYTNPVVTY